ncbi:MAG: archaellum component FlaC [Cyclobacteriaceae bacterium]
MLFATIVSNFLSNEIMMAKKATKAEDKAEDTKGQVENIFSELGKKIDHLIHETKGAKDEVKVEVEKKIKDLKKKKEKLESDFNSYKDKNEDKWHDAKVHIGIALDELKKALSAVVKK